MSTPLPQEIVDKVISEYRKLGKNINRSKLAKKLGINRESVARIINKQTPKVSSLIEPVGKSLQDFIEQYDDSYIVPKLIEEGIEKYLRDQDGEPGYMEDREFRAVCGVSITKWRRYADSFRHLQIRKDNEIIWGHPEIIKKMKEIIAR